MCLDDMLYFPPNMTEMPEKSRKNPFAFLKNSAYNVKRTLVKLT